MKENSLMKLTHVNHSSQFNQKNITEITYVEKKTGNFKNVIKIDDSPIHIKEKDSTTKPVVFQNYLYLLSDATGLYQLYQYDPTNEATKKITAFKYGVDDFFLEDNRLIIKTKAFTKTEPINKQLNRKEMEQLNFQLKHDAKIITSLDNFQRDGYTPFIDVFYSYRQKLSRLKDYCYPTQEKETEAFQGCFHNDSYKKSIVVFNNQFKSEVLEYFHHQRFNIYCITDVEQIKGIKGKKYVFLFENDLITTLPKLKGIQKAVSFSTRSDKCISLGLTNEPMNLGKESLVDSWVQIAKESDIKNVDQISSDVLLVHPQFDYTHPIEEAELLYSALKDRNDKVDVQMLVIPEENQYFFENGNMKKQIRLYDEIISWLKRGNK